MRNTGCEGYWCGFFKLKKALLKNLCRVMKISEYVNKGLKDAFQKKNYHTTNIKNEF